MESPRLFTDGYRKWNQTLFDVLKGEIPAVIMVSKGIQLSYETKPDDPARFTREDFYSISAPGFVTIGAKGSVVSPGSANMGLFFPKIAIGLVKGIKTVVAVQVLAESVLETVFFVKCGDAANVVWTVDTNSLYRGVGIVYGVTYNFDGNFVLCGLKTVLICKTVSSQCTIGILRFEVYQASGGKIKFMGVDTISPVFDVGSMAQALHWKSDSTQTLSGWYSMR